MKILLTGANGYIGQRLLLQLAELGHQIVCCVRDKNRFVVPLAFLNQITVIEIDFSTGKGLDCIPKDIHCAYYLIHSMSGAEPDFDSVEDRCAQNFVSALATTQVKQVIYLGAIVNEKILSKHLSSRLHVETVLKRGAFALTTLRAGIIVGSGSASFEIIRDLVEKLPVMVTPKWVKTRCQPIAIGNVIQFLVGVLDNAKMFDKSFDIGGNDILCYKDMLLGFAKTRNLKRYILTLPFLSPKLSSYWLFFVTGTPYYLAQNLVASLSVQVICRPNSLAQDLGIKLTNYVQAIELAFDKIEQNQVISSWKDALNSDLLTRGISHYVQIPQHGCLKDYRKTTVADRSKTIEKIWRIGGKNGWYYANGLWRLRGFIDQMMGGVGMQRGRRHPSELKAGDVLDCWRVLYANKAECRLVLYAEMKLPGEAWLEFVVDGQTLHQRATFRAHGISGRLYWWSVYLFHGLIFNGLLTYLAK